MSIDDAPRADSGTAALDVERVVAGFWDLTLPKPEWTHEAHLAVCWTTLLGRSPPEALDRIRPGIRCYNASVGTIDSNTSGYHETLTRYYVAAVAAVDTTTFEVLLTDERVGRTAALRYWSRDRLFSVAARRAWLEPDLGPVPGIDRLG